MEINLDFLKVISVFPIPNMIIIITNLVDHLKEHPRVGNLEVSGVEFENEAVTHAESRRRILVLLKKCQLSSARNRAHIVRGSN